MWNTVLLCKNFTYLCFSITQQFPTKVFLLRPFCGKSCPVHPTVVYVHTPKKSVSQYKPFSSNIKKRKQGVDVFSTKLHDTLAYTAGKNKWFCFDRQSAKHVRARQCSTEPLRPSHLFVLPLSAVYVSVKYRPNTDAVW